MAQLTKERDHLFETIRTYRLLFEYNAPTYQRDARFSTLSVVSVLF